MLIFGEKLPAGLHPSSNAGSSANAINLNLLISGYCFFKVVTTVLDAPLVTVYS